MSVRNSIFVYLSIAITPVLFGQKKADFSRFVVTGDSLTAGYQNNQLVGASQIHGYANVIATQAGVSLNLPLFAGSGFPQFTLGYPQITIEGGFAVPTGATMVGRSPGQTYDLAVPGFNVADLVGLQPPCNPPSTLQNAVVVMAAEILNPACKTPSPTELQEAVSLKPTTSIMWIGANDLLYTVLYGDAPTNLLSFAEAYNTAITSMAQASGHLVVANIPDVTLVPYLTSIPELAAILHLPVLEVEVLYGLYPGDMVTPYALAAIQAMGTSPAPLPTNGPAGPIVVRAATVLELKATVLAYNAVIAFEAAANHATLVDIYSLVNNLAANGTVVNGVKLTTQFGGGLFSLDGVHPTNTGYAIIANQFITTMNQSIAAGIPPVSVEQVSKTDPLFP